MTHTVTYNNTDTARRVRATLLTPIFLGGLVGMRSATPLAAISSFAADVGDERLQTLFAHPLVKLGLQGMALGELVADKLPFTPARTDTLPLLGRIFFGGVVGALTYPKARLLGAALGALAAAGVTYATYHLRRALTHEVGIPDPIVALAEDALVVTSARAAASAASDAP
jgi:uncharacterized membrane protein